MAGLTVYIGFWAAWWAWVQTVGRIAGPFTGLGLASALIFDALFIATIVFYFRRNGLGIPHFVAGVKEWSKPKPKELRGILGILAWFVVVSIGFTVGFQVPLDWDGMDYHLPPLVEAWKNGVWGPSLNPYFAARNYPKTAGFLYLWYICHFGKLAGLAGILLISTLHWQAGLVASLKLVEKISSNWRLRALVFLFWVSFPLAARQAGSAYADLAGLSTLLCFCALVRERRFGFAALALGLHSSIKFTNIASTVGALIGLALWARASRTQISFRTWGLFAAAFAVFASAQPLANLASEGKIFGPLQCKILGVDLCDGTLNPATLVVSPTIEIPAEATWIKKVAVGWTPSQVVTTADIAHGGFGWAWILAIGFMCVLVARSLKKMKSLSEFKSVLARVASQPLALPFLVLGAADLLVPALWYPRYHMLLGWCLIVGAALVLHFYPLRKLVVASLVLVSLQMVWLIPQRTWFLGVHRVEEWPVVWQNIKNIVFKGYPVRATHPADLRSLDLYATEKKIIKICGPDLRPSLAAWGAGLSNDVEWTCDEANRRSATGIIATRTGHTKYWVLEKPE